MWQLQQGPRVIGGHAPGVPEVRERLGQRVITQLIGDQLKGFGSQMCVCVWWVMTRGNVTEEIRGSRPSTEDTKRSGSQQRHV